MNPDDDNDWKFRGACAQQGVDPDIFFPRRDAGRASPTRDASVTRARQFCNACPVRQQCAQAALDGGEYFGVWAGVFLSGTRSGPLMHQLKLCAADPAYRPKREAPQKNRVDINMDLEQRRALVLDMLRQGFSVTAIAEKAGTSSRSVMRDTALLRKRGDWSGIPRRDTERRTTGEIVTDLLSKGHSCHEIAAQTGLTRRQVQAHRTLIARTEAAAAAS